MESFGMSGVSGNKVDLSGSWTKIFSSSKSDNGVYPKDFHKFPGTMQDLYNKAAIKIGLPHVKANANAPANPLVVRELNNQNTKFHIEIKTPQQQAATMISEATSSLPILGKSVDTLQIANEMMAIRRELPNLSGGIEREVMKQLGNAGDQSRFAQDLRTVAGYPARADYELRTMAGANAVKQPTIDRAQLNAEVNAVITDATSKGTVNVKGEVIPVAVTFSTERVVAQLSALAETNPQKAQLLRSELTVRLTPSEAGAMNRMLAKDGGFIENTTVALNDPGDAAIGAAKGLANDGIGILNVLGRGGALQAAADAEQAAALQSLFGQDKAAAQSRQSAETLRQVGQQDVIPSIPYKNAAQQGGANILTAAELAGGAEAVYSGGKWLVKSAPEMLAKGGKQVDEVAAPLIRQLDKFDEIAAKAKIDMPHILDGHLNAKGKAVGFHARPDGIDPPGARMTQQVGLKNPQDVYIGKVEIRDPVTGNWVPKKSNAGLSSFYPDNMTLKEIDAAIRQAYADALRKGQVEPSGEFIGDSGLGFQIEGAARNGNIPTAYPIYE
jgi:hypothetical protein